MLKFGFPLFISYSCVVFALGCLEISGWYLSFRFPADLLFTSSSGELWRMVRIGGQPLGFGKIDSFWRFQTCYLIYTLYGFALLFVSFALDRNLLLNFWSHKVEWKAPCYHLYKPEKNCLEQEKRQEIKTCRQAVWNALTECFD